MVADRSFKIGCAISYCDNAYFLVCNYYPAGNLLGRAAYTSGPTASQCIDGAFEDGLCLEPSEERLPKTPEDSDCGEDDAVTNDFEIYSRDTCHQSYVTTVNVVCSDGKSQEFIYQSD